MRTNLGLKSGNPQTDANRRLTTLENIVQQIPGRPMSVISTDTIGDAYLVQAAHGFSVGTVINWDGTSWGKAQGNTADNGIWNGVVSRVHGANAFDIVYSGIITSKTAFTQTPGDLYYLSSSTAGLAVNPVDTASAFQAPVFMCVDENTLQVFPCAAVAAAKSQDESITFTGTTSFAVPAGASQLTFFVIAPGQIGISYISRVVGPPAYYLSGSGGPSSALGMVSVSAADVTGLVTVTITGNSATISMTWKGHTLSIESVNSIAGIPGAADCSYAGTDSPAFIGIPGSYGGAPVLSQASATIIYTAAGTGARGWGVGKTGSSYGAGGNGGDAFSNTSPTSGGGGIAGLIY